MPHYRPPGEKATGAHPIDDADDAPTDDGPVVVDDGGSDHPSEGGDDAWTREMQMLLDEFDLFGYVLCFDAHLCVLHDSNCNI